MNVSILRLCISSASQALSDRQDDVNKLNVFPVPDGDTGTNMSLTMESVVEEVKALPATATPEQLSDAVIHGSLMGARGNSGVILSQILRGFCEGIDKSTIEFDSKNIAAALKNSVKLGCAAVHKPVKGTILTVIEDVSKVANKCSREKLDIAQTLNAIANEAYESCARTPEFLPVLKENGVVDSGGFGLTLLIVGFVSAFSGSDNMLKQCESLVGASASVAIEQVNDWAGSKYKYCTEFLLHSETIKISYAKKYLSKNGDCEILVGSHPDFKVHVHTDNPGQILSYMTDKGEISEVFVHNMKLESQERADRLAEEESISGESKEADSITAGDKVQSQKRVFFGKRDDTTDKRSRKSKNSLLVNKAEALHEKIALVAVASGKGIVELLHTMGVDVVVSGGQTMNPSTSDLIAAANLTKAQSVIFLPSNKNIVMSANTAADTLDIPAKVVPTKSVCATISAIFGFDEGQDLDANLQAMGECIENLVCGEITRAIKKSQTALGESIKKNDAIGLLNGSLDFVKRTVKEVLFSMLDEHAAGKDTLTLIAGKDLKEKDFKAICDEIEEKYPDLFVDAHRGFQPLYPLIFSLE